MLLSLIIYMISPRGLPRDEAFSSAGRAFFHINTAIQHCILDKLTETHHVSYIIIMSRVPLDTPKIQMCRFLKLEEYSKFEFLFHSPIVLSRLRPGTCYHVYLKCPLNITPIFLKKGL